MARTEEVNVLVATQQNGGRNIRARNEDFRPKIITKY